MQNDEKFLGIDSAEKLREVNGNSYSRNSTQVRIITEVNKKIFLSQLPYVNKYIYFKLDYFIKQYSRLKWIDTDYKMFVFIIDDTNVNFQTDFLCVQSLKKDLGTESDRITEYAKGRYTSFNNIYSSIYDDKKLMSYFEFPLAWLPICESESNEVLNNEMLIYFFNIICNKKLDNSKFLIRGHKAITVNLNVRQVSYIEAICIKELFEFVLDIDKHHDKLSLLRNTMTIFLDSQSDEANFFDKSNEILKAVKYNFDLYIQDKVKLFFDQKNKLLQEFILTTKKIEDLTNGLISQMKTIALSLLGSIFLSLLNDLNKVSTHALLNLVLLSYIFFFLFNMIIVFNQKEQKDSLTESLKNYTSSLGVVGGSQNNSLSYETLKDEYLQKSLNLFDSYRKWTLIGLTVLLFMFLSLYVANRFGTLTIFKDAIKFIIDY
ncbi:hypothetical protein HAX42_16865 [Enterococcus casseliflavus]|nr:hypothetical protein [Enterococcus casseliflavus]